MRVVFCRAKYFLSQGLKFAFAPQYVEEKLINHMYWPQSYLSERQVQHLDYIRDRIKNVILLIF